MVLGKYLVFGHLDPSGRLCVAPLSILFIVARVAFVVRAHPVDRSPLAKEAPETPKTPTL